MKLSTEYGKWSDAWPGFGRMQEKNRQPENTITANKFYV